MTQTADVLADDRLLDALADGMAAPDERVVELLAALRVDCQTEALVPLPRARHSQERLTRSELRLITGGRRRIGRRVAVAVLAGAAVAGVSLGGVSAAAAQATPGSGLWGVSRVLYPARANSLEAKQKVTQALADARRYESAGHSSEATKSLNQAASALPHVRAGDGADSLRTQVTNERGRVRHHAKHPRQHASPPSALPSPRGTISRHDRRHGSRWPSPSPSPVQTYQQRFRPGPVHPSGSPSVSGSPSPSESGSGSPSPSPSESAD